MTHICVRKLSIIGSDNGLSPGRRQAIIWTNDGILLIGTLRTNFSEILSEINTFSLKNAFENVVWKMAFILFGTQCVNKWDYHQWFSHPFRFEFHPYLQQRLMTPELVMLPSPCTLTPNDVNVHKWMGHHWLREWLVACFAPSHYLNHLRFSQCRLIISWTPRNKII